MKSKILDSILQYDYELEKYSYKVSQSFAAVTIHHFRTTTKKLRALLRWQNVQKDILPNSFLKLYHTSGDLRDAQILLVNLNEDKIKLPGFILWLANFIGGREMDWNKMDHKKILRKLGRKISSLELENPFPKTVQLFFTKRMIKLKSIVESPSPPDDKLHEVRKMLKDMQYIRQWCKSNWAAGINVSKKISLLQLKKLGEVAGYYNDKRTELLLLAAYLDDETNDKAIRSARIVQKKLEQRKTKLKKQLLRYLIQFCQRMQPAYSPAKN